MNVYSSEDTVTDVDFNICFIMVEEKQISNILRKT